MQSLRNHFLLAMPHLEDPNFAGSLSYLCDHDDNGTMGVIVNHPLELTLDALLEQLELDAEECPMRDQPVYYGGPTHRDRGFILHRGSSAPWDSSIQVADDVALTTSMDMLQAIAAGEGPEQFIVCLGCCGWGAGQLEQELKENTWLTVEAQPGVIFDLPAEQRLNAAAGILGVDLSLLTSQAGHS
ncbi:YqgE/AlgH family protein [Halomonas sp. HP20-15]|uniref:YqgE/AlgH family protein n=1 Tax=Halomonas sp. HP20-15 TaxID=3085901 RepID=UPI00298277AF|nr:YqgE/AlgH family protein [Halomonas sp. HP20-15]MDW5375969.1 YqgE/AlgH family protein [Halomonas sp. HP20-15]